MDNLQTGLAVVGGLVLAAMVAHNVWNTNKNQTKKPHVDVNQNSSVEDQLTEPGLNAENFDDENLSFLKVDTRSILDSLIDTIAPISLESPISGDTILQALPLTRRVGSKPFAVEGFNEITGIWERPIVGVRYSRLQAGVQLANRLGGLNEIEYSEFVMKTQNFSDLLNGLPDFPDMLEQVARANELDIFASENDAQLEFFIKARQAAWSPGYIYQITSKLGFIPGSIPGRMVLPASNQGLPPILSLSFDSQTALADDLEHSAVRDLSVVLDVPHVDRHEQAFSRMVEITQSMVDQMDGLLVEIGRAHV